MRENKGEETLIPKERWVDPKEIQGAEIKTLRHPIIEEAFQKILEMYIPKHDIALVSLCTTSRPYSTSRKWKRFKKMWEDEVDFIICSNGGIIPLEFENCYPYLTYDAHGEKENDREYVEQCYRRLRIFFKKFEYKRIIFNFRPNLRNRIAAENFKKRSNTECLILPTTNTYAKARSEGFSDGTMYPDLDRNVVEEIDKAIKKPF